MIFQVMYTLLLAPFFFQTGRQEMRELNNLSKGTGSCQRGWECLSPEPSLFIVASYWR